MSELTKAQVARRDAERKMQTATLKALVAAGYAIGVDNGADEEESKRSSDVVELQSLLGQTCEDVLYCYKGGDEDGESSGFVSLVYGNLPSELIADYTMNLNEALKPVQALSEKLDAQGL